MGIFTLRETAKVTCPQQNFEYLNSDGCYSKETLGQGRTFTWERLNYHVPSSNGPLRLLHDVYGYVKPGTLTALMGASGAGTW